MKTNFMLAWDVTMQMLVLHQRRDDLRGNRGFGMCLFDKGNVETLIDELTHASPFQKYALKRHAKRILKALRPIRNYKPRPEPIPDPESSARVQAALMAAAANLRTRPAYPTYHDDDSGVVILDIDDEAEA